MINQLLNHIFLGANRAQMNIGYAHLGIITSVDPTDYTVKVQLQPEEIETGFIPFCTPFYGWVAPPVGGEQCLVLFERGNNNVPVAALLLYWDQARAPGVSSPGDTGGGEILLKHSSGSYVKLNKAGKILINGHVEIDVTTPKLVITTTGDVDVNAGGNASVIASGNATLQGNSVAVTGNTITLGNGTAVPDALTLFNELKAVYDAHEHTNGNGGANTGVPTVALPSSAATAVVSGA